MTYWYPGVFEAIRQVKSLFPDVPVVLGGVYATLCHQHAREFSGADYIIKGRGELKSLKIADKIAGIKRNYSSAPNKEDELPYPTYHLISRVKSVSLMSSFGCPFRCSYCASRLLQPIFYQRKSLEIIQEINYFSHNFGVKDIAFYDDALLVNPERYIDPILDMIIKRFKNIRFHTPNGLHIRYID